MVYKTPNLQDILNNSKDFDEYNVSKVTSKEFGLSSVFECFVCGKEEIGTKGNLPEGWKIVKKYKFTLCPKCSNDLSERMKK